MSMFNKEIENRVDESSAIKKLTQTEKTVNDFVMDLSGKSPVPGGGGASALTGALGAALGGMVASLTIGREIFKNVEDEISALKVKSYNLQKELLDLVEEDAQVFLQLSAVYKMPNSTEEEKANKARLMESALKDAAETPLKIMRKSCEAIAIMDDFAKKGNNLAVSDAGCGVILCKSALQSAWLNVCINTGSMKDHEYAKSLNDEGILLLKEYIPLADSIYAYVEKQLL